MLADELDYVIGVDTHRDEHVLAVVTAPAGAVVAGATAPATAGGYRDLLRVATGHAPGRRAWAIEGTGSYGAGFARFLAGQGEAVREVSRTPRAERRLRGKDDALDAARTARAALASETLALPRSGERREALRLRLVARRSAVDVRREALAQLRAVIVTAPDRLRDGAAHASDGPAAQALQPPAPLSHRELGRARDPACPAQPRQPHPGGDGGSRPTRA
jgi:transposase